MSPEVRHPNRPTLPDHQAEDAMPLRGRTDQGPLLVVNTMGNKAFQQPPIGTQYAQRRIVGTDYLGSDLNHALQYPVK